MVDLEGRAGELGTLGAGILGDSHYFALTKAGATTKQPDA